MKRIHLLSAAVLVSVTDAFSQTPKPVSAFDRELIEQQKQFLQAAQTRNPIAVDRAIADDFHGIATNGDFYDKSEVVESAQAGMPKDTRAYDFQVGKLNDDSPVRAHQLNGPGEQP